jgi:hypothetical protein
MSMLCPRYVRVMSAFILSYLSCRETNSGLMALALISVILRKLEFQGAYCNRDLRISESSEGIPTNRCSVLFDEKRQINGGLAVRDPYLRFSAGES